MTLGPVLRRHRDVLPVLAAASLLLASAGRADAQVPAASSGQVAQGQTDPSLQPVAQVAKPYRGLFGAGSAPAPGRQQLDLTTNIYEEYGTNNDAAAAGASTGTTPGWFLAGQGRLALQSTGQRTGVALRLDGSMRYYRQTRLTTVPGARAEIVLNNRVGARATGTVSFSASAEYQPYYVLPIFQTPVLPAADTAILPTNRDDLLYRRTGYIYAETLGFERPLSQRTFFAIDEDVRVTRTQSADLDVDNIRAGGVFGIKLSPYASFITGYAYRLGQSGVNRSVRTTGQDINLGLDYRRPLPRQRRTTFGFASGSSRVTTATGSTWFVTCTTDLRFEFDGGWFIQADYGRQLRMVEGFASPFFANTVTGSLGGFMGRRVEVLATGGYSQGRVGTGTDGYRSSQGSGRMRLAMSRYVAMDVEGLLNKYAFDQQVMLPGSLPATLNRWAVRSNVAIWLPLFR